MFNRIRRVFIGRRVTLDPKAVGKVNFRQVFLFAIAAIIAIRIVLFDRQGELSVRLTVAVFIALILVTIAIVPFRGTTFERAIFEMVSELFGPKEYLHQTAEQIEDKQPKVKPVRKPKVKQTKTREANLDTAGALTLDRPNFGLLLLLFMGLMTVASVLTYAARSGSLSMFVGFQ